MNVPKLSDPRVLVNLVIGVFIVGFLVTVPFNYYHRSKLKKLQPADVGRITIELRAPVKGQAQPGVVLTEAERRDFLRLLAESSYSLPSHPKGGWTRFARIESNSKNYYLPIHASENNGTLVWHFSGGTDGWNFGTLRNDELKPFVEGVLSRIPGTNEPPIVSPASK